MLPPQKAKAGPAKNASADQVLLVGEFGDKEGLTTYNSCPDQSFLRLGREGLQLVDPIGHADLECFRRHPQSEEEAEEGRLGEFTLNRFLADQLSEKRAPNKVGEAEAEALRFFIPCATCRTRGVSQSVGRFRKNIISASRKCSYRK